MSFILIRENKKQNLLSKISEIKYIDFTGFDIDGQTTLYIDDLKSNIDRNSNKKIYTVGYAFNENDVLLREFGVYCAIDCTRENISIYTDLMGYYPVFYLSTKDQIIITDRLDLIKKAYNHTLNINTVACNEYIFGELIHGTNTFYKEINRLGILESIIIDGAELKIVKETYDLNQPANIEMLLEHYDKYISLIEKKYRKYILKLSGGYDSRLNLALFLTYAKKNVLALNLNINPHDEEIAKKIAKDFNLNFNILDEEIDKIIYSQGNFNVKEEDKDIELVISGQCGELNRGYYYYDYKTEEELNNLTTASDYYLAIFPLYKRLFMTSVQRKSLKDNVAKEVERIKKEFNQNKLFKILDYIYLNRVRNYFALKMADPTNKNLPTLVDPIYFRFRLNYSYNEIIIAKAYDDIFKRTTPGLLAFPFKSKRWYHTDTFLKMRRVLPILFAKKNQKQDLGIGLSAKNDKLFNGHKPTRNNYNFLKKMLNSNH